MLIYESEGFLEVEASNINRLCRSKDPLTFTAGEDSDYELTVALCDLQDNSRSRCYVAFHSKTLQKSMVFSVKGSDAYSSWQHGQDVLVGLGCQLEDINLKLSPAMLEVILRNVPGLVSPAEARKYRDEKSLSLAELQALLDKDPENAEGKRAALKLGAEKRLNQRAEELRQLLIDILTPVREDNADFDALMEQVQDLTAKLEVAEAVADQERKQREMSESIAGAAEKRIQELEEILVDVETKSASELKQRQKVLSLQGRINELEEQLEAAAAEIKAEQSKQMQFIADFNEAQEKISALEKNLQKTEQMLAESYDQLAEEQSVKEQLEGLLKTAETRVEEIGSELREMDKQVAQRDDEAKLTAALQRELDEVKSELREAQKQNEALSSKLAAAEEKSSALEKRLEDAVGQKPVDQAQDQEQLAELQARLKQLNDELDALREEHLHDRSIRKRLEKGASEDDKRIRELEEALETTRKEVPVADDNASATAEQVELLKAEVHQLKRELRDEQTTKEGLERELDQSHRMIDSLEQMVRETAKSPGKEPVINTEETQKLVKLEAKLELLTEQLAQERNRQEELAEAVLQAEKKLAAQEEAAAKKPLNKNIANAADRAPVAEQEDSKPARSGKPLPHELRPAPTKGAFFHPDWDLEGLPCQSEAQVVRAWETVFNVQISLEGYPSQYCMAFLVVLKVKNVKKLYMLFRLKQSKHTLVSVPAKIPKNEEQLQQAIKEGLRFLKTSGFDMEEMPKEYIANTLGSYFKGE